MSVGRQSYNLRKRGGLFNFLRSIRWTFFGSPRYLPARLRGFVGWDLRLMIKDTFSAAQKTELPATPLTVDHSGNKPRVVEKRNL